MICNDLSERCLDQRAPAINLHKTAQVWAPIITCRARHRSGRPRDTRAPNLQAGAHTLDQSHALFEV
jgi:hypothetical protein